MFKKNKIQMGVLIKFILSVTFLVSLQVQSFGQKKDFSITPNVGVTTPLLDGGIGFHAGANPAYSILPIFAVEGQVSYIYTKVNSGFLSGSTGHEHAVNTLAGARLYFNQPEKKNRFYINVLVGAHYKQETTNGVQYDGEVNFGYAAGFYVTLHKVLLGLSYDTPQNVILKIGYVI